MRKKLIEVALPLDAINAASAREKSIRHGHPSSLHLWWARRPLAACRAVLFAQLVDDPSAWPGLFPAEEDQDRERRRIFRLIEELVKWENSSNATVIEAARLEIARSFARARVEDGDGDARDERILRDDVRSDALLGYLADVVPPVHDPFAGGGSIPVEAQRLGLRALATDLNPVAVMINKALIEIPPKFVHRSPVGPESDAGNQGRLGRMDWPHATGLAEDVRRYGEWVHAEAFRQIGSLYPQVELPEEHGGGKGTVIAWIWARTVPSPNPAFRGVHVPLVTNFFVSTKKGKETWVEPIIEGKNYRFEIRTGTPKDREKIKSGTKAGRGTFACLLSGATVTGGYIDQEAQAGRMSARLIAVCVGANRKRVFVAPTSDMEDTARKAQPTWSPEINCRGTFASNAQGRRYAFKTFADYFTARQLVALATLSDLVSALREKVIKDAREAQWEDSGRGLDDGGAGATAYGDAIAAYVAMGISKTTDYNSSLVSWSNSRDQAAHVFTRQAIPMMWDFCEVNPFAGAAGDLTVTLKGIAKVLDGLLPGASGEATQGDATLRSEGGPFLIATDPPYYDNIGYADLSDYFFVWLRPMLREIFPKLFSTILVPKSEELVATPHRHSTKEIAEEEFLKGMTQAMTGMAQSTQSDLPVTLFYAFKQSEVREEGVSSTGWETFLEAVLSSGFCVTGTWPVRTERGARTVSIGANALASSVVLVCRKKLDDTGSVSRGDFRRALKRELPGALVALQKGNIAPVDMAQASIGPGMAMFSQHEMVIEADGSPMLVRSALQLIHQVVDESIDDEEGEFDQDTRFAITWFESHGFEEGPYGDAETLATARSVSVSGVEQAGVLKSVAGKVRLLTRNELPNDWDPETDERLTVWECTQHLIKRLNEDGEAEAAAAMSKMGSLAEQARNLAYRLYTTCERKGWAEEAQAYNGLVLAWPELEKLAAESGGTGGTAPQTEMFE